MKSTRDEPRFYIQNKQYPELFVKKFNMLSESDYCSIETYISNVRSHPLNFSTQNENFLNELFNFNGLKRSFWGLRGWGRRCCNLI